MRVQDPNRELTYWLREGRSSNAEVDYVIALDGNINTVINVDKQRKEVSYPLISLPLYLVERLNEVVGAYFENAAIPFNSQNP